jgi:hypothetical protein
MHLTLWHNPGIESHQAEYGSDNKRSKLNEIPCHVILRMSLPARSAEAFAWVSARCRHPGSSVDLLYVTPCSLGEGHIDLTAGLTEQGPGCRYLCIWMFKHVRA